MCGLLAICHDSKNLLQSGGLEIGGIELHRYFPFSSTWYSLFRKFGIGTTATGIYLVNEQFSAAFVSECKVKSLCRIDLYFSEFYNCLVKNNLRHLLGIRECKDEEENQ